MRRPTTHRRRCGANIPDPPPAPAAPKPVEAPELGLEDEDEAGRKKKKKRPGKQALRISGLTIGSALSGGSGIGGTRPSGPAA
jgi:hypothetical protein